MCKKSKRVSLGALMKSKHFLLSLATIIMSERKAVIKNADMSEEMQQDAVDIATQALEKYNIEKDIAAFIKKEFDKKYNPTWHCIVGRNFGSYVSPGLLDYHRIMNFPPNLTIFVSFLQPTLHQRCVQLIDWLIDWLIMKNSAGFFPHFFHWLFLMEQNCGH